MHYFALVGALVPVAVLALNSLRVLTAIVVVDYPIDWDLVYWSLLFTLLVAICGAAVALTFAMIAGRIQAADST